ncbi:DNA mismatch repair endonuclease MutH [Neptunicella sp. SCSIO 80796]|uniref:DNA mismatch repair endonuclease MutH n=1 Tax=Neptunicella plasticusilytica TaxID=3117012 RepID=UPI003A4D7CC6
MQPPLKPPESVKQLLQRAQQIAGLTLGELAAMAEIKVPDNFQRHKGWSGQLLELWLGAQAGSKPQQDFPELGVELKSIPVDHQGKPLETTYVCYAHLTGVGSVSWEQSNIRNKLSHVLWIPVEGSREIPPQHRRVGYAFLWQPDATQLRQLQQDWEELMEMIALGQIEQITARQGEVLQLRPKAANGSALTEAIGAEGSVIQTRPRGFYLKKNFTASILNNMFKGV